MMDAPAKIINNAQAHANTKGLPVVVFKVSDDDFGPFRGWGFATESEYSRNHEGKPVDTKLYPNRGLDAPWWETYP